MTSLENKGFPKKQTNIVQGNLSIVFASKF